MSGAITWMLVALGLGVVVVRRRVGEALDVLGSASRVLSLCAGDGRDLLPSSRPGAGSPPTCTSGSPT